MTVIDSSAMVDALVDEPANPELLALVADTEMHAPALIDYEVASALRDHALGGKLTVRQVEDAADDFSKLVITRYPLSTISARSWSCGTPSRPTTRRMSSWHRFSRRRW